MGVLRCLTVPLCFNAWCRQGYYVHSSWQSLQLQVYTANKSFKADKIYNNVVVMLRWRTNEKLALPSWRCAGYLLYLPHYIQVLFTA